MACESYQYANYLTKEPKQRHVILQNDSCPVPCQKETFDIILQTNLTRFTNQKQEKGS